MSACTGTENAHPSPTVNTTLVFPWIRPENKAKDSSPRGQQGLAMATVSVVAPTLTSAAASPSLRHVFALGWEVLPKFCQGCKLERLRSGHCTDPALLANQGFPSAQTQLRTSSVLQTQMQGQKVPHSDYHGLTKKDGIQHK